MLSVILTILLAFVVSTDAACNIKFPNGTATNVHWWQCNKSPISFSNARTFDKKGNKMYPLRVDGPIIIKVDMNNPSLTLRSPNLRITATVWTWGGMRGCGWHSIPTFGLLNNLDACKYGVPCPIRPGKRTITLTLDLSKFQRIVKMLMGDQAYQVQLQLEDKTSHKTSCLMGQLRVKV